MIIKNDKLKKIVLILTVIMLISFSVGFVLFALTGGISNYYSSEDIMNMKKEEIFEITNINNIMLNAVHEDIIIIPTNEVKAKVILHRSMSEKSESFAPELIIDQNHNDLKISVRYKNRIFFTLFDFYQKSYLEFYLPQDYTKNLSIETVSGNISMDKAKIFNTIYKSVSGNIKVNDVNSHDVSISTTSGKVEIKGQCDNFNFKSVSGDIISSELFTKESNFNTTSGDISIKKFNGSITVQTISGKIKINYSDFDNDIHVKSTSGDVDLVLPATAEFKLNFRSTSGDYNSDFPVTIKNSNHKHNIDGYVKNDKNIIEVSTVSGNLEIRN